MIPIEKFLARLDLVRQRSPGRSSMVGWVEAAVDQHIADLIEASRKAS